MGRVPGRTPSTPSKNPIAPSSIGRIVETAPNTGDVRSGCIPVDRAAEMYTPANAPIRTADPNAKTSVQTIEKQAILKNAKAVLIAGLGRKPGSPAGTGDT